MKQLLAAGAIIVFAGLVGLHLGVNGLKAPEVPQSFENSLQAEQKENSTADGQKNRSLEFGTAHEHALFYLVHNGSEVSFLEDRYQVASSYVHFENRKPHIVHKHSKNVTWQYFFDTIDLEVSKRNESNYCVNVKNIDYCGEAAIQLNGEKAELSQEIQQGDNFVIVLQENPEESLGNYSSRELPDDYKPSEAPGRSL